MKRIGLLLLSVVVIGAGAWWLKTLHESPRVPTTTSTFPSTTLTPQPSIAVWPYVDSALRFATPEGAARSFATDFLGMTSPLVGSFQRGDSRSGEVVIRAGSTSPGTTVLVRQLDGSATWWVLGAVAPSIRLTSPKALAALTSPVRLTGSSTAFEAVVNVEVRVDGTLTPIVTTTVMGGSMGVFRPFQATIGFATPSAVGGALV
ncbi:MAG: hypothetical protein HKL86_04265, partial [Acidimicrobiaceae bacterium]|nr:hypothetical protein [Acidimicrobiaceae bacterium]